jgi:aryl-alcohol dehydrogenase-like predicted oxidoreductase
VVSVVGLGCDNFGHRCDSSQAAAIVRRAIELGVTLFDTSDIYGPNGLSEEYLGKALERRRDEVVIATKFVGPTGPGPLDLGSSRHHILRAVEASLRRLGTDYIDLYQLHNPFPVVPIEETLRALDDLIHQGKVRYMGTCNFSGWELVDANWTARSEHLHRFVSAQNCYNLLDRQVERELLPACAQHGIGILPYFPLASGFLTGKYRNGMEKPEDARLSRPGSRTQGLVGQRDDVLRMIMPEALRWLADDTVFTAENYAILEALVAFAEARGHTVLELAIGWLASQPNVASVLVGATKPEQIGQNVAAADWKLSPDEATEVARITASRVNLPAVPPQAPSASAVRQSGPEAAQEERG